MTVLLVVWALLLSIGGCLCLIGLFALYARVRTLTGSVQMLGDAMAEYMSADDVDGEEFMDSWDMPCGESWKN